MDLVWCDCWDEAYDSEGEDDTVLIEDEIWQATHLGMIFQVIEAKNERL